MTLLVVATIFFLIPYNLLMYGVNDIHFGMCGCNLCQGMTDIFKALTKVFTTMTSDKKESARTRFLSVSQYRSQSRVTVHQFSDQAVAKVFRSDLLHYHE